MPGNETDERDDGWTVIGRGKGGKVQHVSGLAPIFKDLTLERLRADFSTKMKLWQASTCRKDTRDILRRQQPDEGWQLENAVCLATNSFSRDNWQARHRSMLQFAAFYDMADSLGRLQGRPLKLVAQEPNYTPLDVDFLADLDVQILAAGKASCSNGGLGEAEDHIHPSSFVFEAFLDLDANTVQRLLAGEPRLYIGSSLARLSAKPLSATTGQFRRVQAALKEQQPRPQEVFARSRASYRLPRFDEDPNVFEGLSIYWQNPSEENDQEEG
jgi:hypothetical protein